MIDVPDYLLKRSQERRAALEGSSIPDAGSEDAKASGTPVAAVPSPTTKTLVPITPKAPVAELPVPPSVKAASSRLKIPYWVMPVLLFLPIWAFIYVGTLEEPTRAATGILADGTNVYRKIAACSTCHKNSGGGSNSGPPLSNGNLLKVFPENPTGIAQHIEWVVKGTEGIGVGVAYGSAEAGRMAGWFGNMAGFGNRLTARQILEVVLYERSVLANNPESATLALQMEAALNTGSLTLPDKWSADVTIDQILTDLKAGFDLSTDVVSAKHMTKNA